MAKFAGMIGFQKSFEASPGEWRSELVERPYYGDILKNNRRNESNSNTTILSPVVQNRFSILADSFLLEHCYSMCYIKYLGTRWKVESVEINSPRVMITIGGIYNGQTA